MTKILIVEDKESLRDLLKRLLSEEGWDVTTASDGDEAVEKVRREFFHLVLTDMKLPHLSGMDVLKAARQADSRTEVVVMTAFGSIESSVAAVKEGAYDYLTKPVDNDHLLHILRKALENQALKMENMALKVARGEPPLQVAGESRAFREALRVAEKAAESDATVLLTGESGSGKEVFARLIHQRSRRASKPFLSLNCGALAPTLFESELFGHEKGAFTGAVERKIGRAEAAEGGTLFLDEITEIPLELQVKLLRFLQELEYERVGSTRVMRADVRVVAATNRDAVALVKQGRFREDLYYRLNVVTLRVPPLRERPEDVPILADLFLARHARKAGRRLAFAPGAYRALATYPWPGNVRELEHSIQRAVVLASGEILDAKSLMIPETPPVSSPDPGASLRKVAGEAQRQAEKRAIQEALEESRGNKSVVARRLKVSYKTLLTKIKQFGLGK
jgi:two-component system response regulator HydG